MTVRRLTPLALPMVILAMGCARQDPDELAAPPPKPGAVVEKNENKNLIGGEGPNRTAAPPPTDGARGVVVN